MEITFSQPAIGDTVPLNHSLKAKQRIWVGLRWDPTTEKPKFFDKLFNKDISHNLDISCYIYNTNHEFIDFVGAEAQDSMDETENIYHSGDDSSGEGDGDDERISVELAGLPDSTHGIVFMVEVRSDHIFGQINAPYVRLADSMTNENLLETAITGPTVQNTNAFVFCSVFRNDASPTGWMLRNISESPDISKIADWGSYLAQFVD